MKSLQTPTRLRAGSNHLTTGHAAQLAEQISNSFEGMAAWAGSGPPDATCGNCLHWFGGGWGRNRTCNLFKRMTGCGSKAVPGTAKACRYFEQIHTGNKN